MLKTTYVTIMASQKDGTLYIGVTNDLVRRIWEHRNSVSCHSRESGNPPPGSQGVIPATAQRASSKEC